MYIEFILKKGILCEATIDHRQHSITVSRSGVKLEIPPGAVTSGKRKYVYVGVSWVDADRCNSIDGKRRVSPVVVCGPPGTKFNKPVILSFPHCVKYDEDQPCPLKVLWKNTNGGKRGGDKWTECSDEDTTLRVAIGENRCVVYTEHFTKYTCVCEQVDHPHEYLRLSVMAYHTVRSLTMPINVRVYIGNANPDEKEYIKREERDLRGTISDSTKFINLHGNSDLHINVEVESEGYQCKGDDNRNRWKYIALRITRNGKSWFAIVSS
ncbi:UNC5C-like protein [Ptychodera flava]|uniref:UNC5C-like protein n=1 Tax=Ptychodera flava TaxID=63121 RepID=UPI003969BD61